MNVVLSHSVCGGVLQRTISEAQDEGEEQQEEAGRKKRGPEYMNDFFMEALNPIFYLIMVVVALVAFSKLTNIMLHYFLYLIKLEA